MRMDTDKMRNGFFKKSFSVGHHNIKYAWNQLMTVVLSCIMCLQSLEEGAKSPSAQTVRDRLRLDGEWLEYFHKAMWNVAKFMVKRFSSLMWFISVDETHVPFFGNRKKLNKKTRKEGLGAFVHGYRAKTPGASGSFCFIMISFHCCKIRIPLFVKIVKVRENYRAWLEQNLKKILALKPEAVVLADRGYGKATWFYLMLERINARYVIRVPLRKKENKNKVRNGVGKFQYWMTDRKTKEKALLTVYVAKDKQDREYLLASNMENRTSKQLLKMYLNRWDIENTFKDADRAELPTSSRNHLMRLFTIVVSFFMFTLWQLERILQHLVISLRTFIKRAVNLLCNLLRCMISPLGELRHIS